MDGLTSYEDPLDVLFVSSLYFSVLFCSLTIMAILLRVMPNAEQKKGYYTMIFSQSAADLLQGGMVITWMTNYSFRVKYVGISLFFVSCMLTAYLAVYWMDVLSRCKLLKKTLFVILGATGTPAVIMSIYLIIRKNSSHEVTSAEWLIYCFSKVIAQSVFCLVVVVCLFQVQNKRFMSAANRRAHRKVAIGLVYKSLGSLLIALYSVYTIIGVWNYGSLLGYMQENPWWERMYFFNTNVYSATNGMVTCWILSGLIFANPRRRKDQRAQTAHLIQETTT